MTHPIYTIKFQKSGDKNEDMDFEILGNNLNAYLNEQTKSDKVFYFYLKIWRYFERNLNEQPGYELGVEQEKVLFEQKNFEAKYDFMKERMKGRVDKIAKMLKEIEIFPSGMKISNNVFDLHKYIERKVKLSIEREEDGYAYEFRVDQLNTLLKFGKLKNEIFHFCRNTFNNEFFDISLVIDNNLMLIKAPHDTLIYPTGY